MFGRARRKAQVALYELGGKPEAVLAEGQDRRALWKRQYRIWNAIHLVFGTAAFVLTLLTAGLPAMIGADHIFAFPLLSLVAAALVGVVAFMTPSKQARSYMDAWRPLDRSIRNWINTPTADALSAILAAIDEGERIIGGKDPY